MLILEMVWWLKLSAFNKDKEQKKCSYTNEQFVTLRGSFQDFQISTKNRNFDQSTFSIIKFSIKSQLRRTVVQVGKEPIPGPYQGFKLTY